jgi:hypothetical protein
MGSIELDLTNNDYGADLIVHYDDGQSADPANGFPGDLPYPTSIEVPTLDITIPANTLKPQVIKTITDALYKELGI